MNEEKVSRDRFKGLKSLDSFRLNYDSFLGLGFESVFIAVIGGILFGFMVGIYPIFTRLLPFLPSTNLFLFIAFGIPLTGSTHYEPKLGVLSSSLLLGSAHITQLFFGIAPYSPEFLFLAGGWALSQIFLIGYLPGKLIPTSESLNLLFKGIFKISFLYVFLEFLTFRFAALYSITGSQLLAFPFYSLPLLLIVTTVTTFLFTNTFCPYMMMPMISGSLKGDSGRHCGSGNYVFKVGKEVKLDEESIKKVSRRGFRMVSKLPSVTVFSCPRGGMISIYNTGDILIRKVNKGTAERINKTLSPILAEA